MYQEKLNELFETRELIKVTEDQLRELQKKGEERKAELMATISDDEILNNLKTEHEVLSEEFNDLIGKFTGLNDSLITSSQEQE